MNRLHSLLMSRAGGGGVYAPSSVTLQERSADAMLAAVMDGVPEVSAPAFAAWLCRHISESPLGDELASLDPGSRYDLAPEAEPVSGCMPRSSRLEAAVRVADEDLVDMAGSLAWPDQAAVCCLHALRRCR